MTVTVKPSLQRLASVTCAVALACSALVVSASTAEAKRLRMLPGTGKTSAPVASAGPTAPAPAQALAPTPVRVAPQPVARSAASSSPSPSLRPAIFLGIGSAQAAPAVHEGESAHRRAAEAAQTQRLSAVVAPSLTAVALPMLGQGDGEARRVPGFEVLN
jgi:hypothetical protein